MEKTMIRTIAKAAVLTVALTATPAFASSEEGPGCGDASRDQWMSVDAAKAKGMALGYEVRQVKEEDGCYEIYAIDKNGARAELYMNPVTGEIIRSNDEDD
jgi:hypothetical protein